MPRLVVGDTGGCCHSGKWQIDASSTVPPRDLSGFWSRLIDDEHRLVYGASDDELIIIQARYQYDG
jgi:Txe/YoeB family toxin of toxin-antitoxin system